MNSVSTEVVILKMFSAIAFVTFANLQQIST